MKNKKKLDVYKIQKEMFDIKLKSINDIVIALAGNPNTGKSTIFNNLTGLNQHTGNWPGKTVSSAQGNYQYNNNQYVLVDLPGTYSLSTNSIDEQITRDFICFAKPDVTVIVIDATCLERNLNLTLQILEITDKVVVCVNLLDEAQRKRIEIDLNKLSHLLGVAVVGTIGRDKNTLNELKKAIEKIAFNKNKIIPKKNQYDPLLENILHDITPYINKNIYDVINPRFISLRLIEDDFLMIDSINTYSKFNLIADTLLQDKLYQIRLELDKKNITLEKLRDLIVTDIFKMAKVISDKVIIINNKNYNNFDRKLDNILTSKLFGIPIMLALLGMIFYLTISGANIPSDLLANGLFYIEERLTWLFNLINAPNWLHSLLILGVYRTLAWVISVMLPPMAIFFPLFTLLEDLGYLSRIAFNLDHFFKKACAHGKQALTMCMGFGCNAAGVISCRIIDSPRERLIAIITNNFVPCNGRFPTLIALALIFIAGNSGLLGNVLATLSILATIILAVIITLVISKLLSKTILKGLPSSFVLELPSYRKPQLSKIIIRSIFDRTLFVLGRAIVIAAPAGVVIWGMANISINDNSLLHHSASFLDPLGRTIGMDGYILMAFILGLPANEIVIPILIMGYMSKEYMLELNTLNDMRQLFINNGWTWLTAISTMLFSLNHWPCGTTLLTIKKETKSLKWTIISFLIPTIIGITLCFIVAQTVRLFGLI